MALNRNPTAIQVNGATLLVKDPDTSTGLFSNWQRVPGLASFTLPDETGSTNETQLMDGSVAFAQIAGVGSITGSVGAITGHPAHQLLQSKRRDGKNVSITIVRPAIAVNSGANALVGGEMAADGKSVVTLSEQIASALREGMLLAIGLTADTLDGYVAYNVAAAAAHDHKYMVVSAVDSVGDNPSNKATVSPGFSADIDPVDTANSENKFAIRRPGILYENITCTVNGFGDGDFQSGSAVGANLSLQPDAALDRPLIEWRIDSEFRAGGKNHDGSTATGGPYNGVFANL